MQVSKHRPMLQEVWRDLKSPPNHQLKRVPCMQEGNAGGLWNISPLPELKYKSIMQNSSVIFLILENYRYYWLQAGRNTVFRRRLAISKDKELIPCPHNPVRWNTEKLQRCQNNVSATYARLMHFLTPYVHISWTCRQFANGVVKEESRYSPCYGATIT